VTASGDESVYEIQDGRVIITKPTKQPIDDPVRHLG
jgi:hypothetical protein